MAMRRISRIISIAAAIVAGFAASPCFADIKLAPFATGLSLPVDIAHAGDGSKRLFVVEQAGRIRVIQNGILLATPFLDLTTAPAIVTSGGEQGLLGLAFHPQYASNGQFFVYFTGNANAGVNSGDIVIARFQRSTNNPNAADPASRANILTIPHSTFANHNGGALRFGPDGYLYIGVGDGGSGGDPFGSGQDRSVLLGKILRIDVTGTATYTIPPTNPYPNIAGIRPEIWSYGVRNPWRFSFDRSTGDFYIGDVGQDLWEEIDKQPANAGGGQNYGWKVLEATHCYSPSTGCTAPANYVGPLLEYSHSVGNSVTGGYVYRGQSTPDLIGKYVFGDFSQSKLFYAPGLAAAPFTQISGLTPQVSTFGESESGELYLANYATGAISSFSSSSDVTPDQVVFFPQTNVAPSSSIQSNPVKISGLGALATLSIAAGEYSLGPANATNCSNSWTTAAATILADATICVRHQSANTGSTARTTTLSIGTEAFVFTTTTVAGPPVFDVTPTVGANGFLSPLGVQHIAQGQTATFTITPVAGYAAVVTGTCGGMLNGVNYVTNAITANCTVIASFVSLLPGPPVIGTAVAGNTQASITFSPPVSDGGTAIIGYKATCLPSGANVTGTSSPITVSGLVNGDTQSCSVTATNGTGTGPASASADVTPSNSAPLVLVAVKSRKLHAGVPRDLTISGAQTVEPRSIGSGHTIVFAFNLSISLAGNPVLTDAADHAIGTATAERNGNDVLITLTDVPDGQRVKLTLNDVNGPGYATTVNLSFLTGDFNSTQSVNASDISAVKAHAGRTVDGANFIFDVNASGAIDSADVASVKARSGRIVP